ncbi:MAG: hypothetical protein AAF602_31935, partial [Myxococcota bacterium]
GVVGVRVRISEAAARLYAVLAASDLGDDVAGLDGARLDTPWAEAIGRAWPRAQGRLALQGLGLTHLELDALLAALASPPDPLRDGPGRTLCSAVRDGLQQLDPPTGFGTAPDTLLSDLQALREQLWAPRGLRPPPLVLLDVPALGRRARATTVDGERRIATSLAMPPDHVLMQVLHEEMHPVTDPLVLAELGHSLADRDTRPGARGFALHQRLEQTAVEATAAFLNARAPEHLGAFERWLGAHSAVSPA